MDLRRPPPRARRSTRGKRGRLMADRTPYAHADLVAASPDRLPHDHPGHHHGGWQVGFGQHLVVDWKAFSGNKVTFPVGIGAGRTFRIGGRMFELDGQVS